LTIQELSRETGIPVGTISNWEARYDALSPPIYRNQRQYTTVDALRLRAIRHLRYGGARMADAVAGADAQVVAWWRDLA
jgi:DNA-binding transcriptional MerR regulator